MHLKQFEVDYDIVKKCRLWFNRSEPKCHIICTHLHKSTAMTSLANVYSSPKEGERGCIKGNYIAIINN